MAHNHPSWTPELGLRRGPPATLQAPWQDQALLCLDTGHPERGPTAREVWQEEKETKIVLSFILESTIQELLLQV